MRYLPEHQSIFTSLNNIVKLEITFLVDLVALAGFFTSYGSLSHLVYLAPLMVSGTLASFSAALFNNIYDADVDSSMNRVAERRANIGKNGRKYTFLAIIMLILSMAVGIKFLSYVSVIFIGLGFLSYVFLYTMFLKRRTDWNIVIGGIAGSFPAIAGSAAFSGVITYASVFVAAMVFIWTPTHFWSLSVKYMDEYRKAKIPMLPVTRGIKNTTNWILINTIILFALTVLPALFNFPPLGISYRIIAIPVGLMMLIPVLRLRPENSVKSYTKVFGISNLYLMFLLIAICLIPVI